MMLISWTISSACSSCLDICLCTVKMCHQMGFVSLRKVEFTLSSETHVNIKRRYEVFQLHNKRDDIVPDSFPSHISQNNPNSWMRDYKALQIDKLWECRHCLPLGLGYLVEGDNALSMVLVVSSVSRWIKKTESRHLAFIIGRKEVNNWSSLGFDLDCSQFNLDCSK